MVASAHELIELRKLVGPKLKLIAPGIRSQGLAKHVSGAGAGAHTPGDGGPSPGGKTGPDDVIDAEFEVKK